MLQTTALAAILILDFGDNSQKAATVSSDPERGWAGGGRRGGVRSSGGTDFPIRDLRLPASPSAGGGWTPYVTSCRLGTGPCGGFCSRCLGSSRVSATSLKPAAACCLDSGHKQFSEVFGLKL